MNTRANIWQTDFGKDLLTHFIEKISLLCANANTFAIVSLTNIHCQRNIARGNLALKMHFTSQ